MKFHFLFLACLALLSGYGCHRQPADAAVAAPRNPATPELPLGIIGESEAVYLPQFTAPFEARIDTGAATSSIDAREIRTFERDGKKFVAFKVSNPSGGESADIELPVIRTVHIKRHGAEAVSRPVVMLTFRLGHLTLQREFTLADREQFEFPVLLGRNVISGLAAVDPSRRNTL